MGQFDFSSSGADAFAQAMQLYAAKAKLAVIEHRNQLMRFLTERIMALTPVWEGDTMANWVWSVGAPSGEYIEPATGGVEPGPTNSMPLGSEPRRSVNEAIVLKTLETCLTDVNLDDMFLTNVSDSAMGVEFGILPTPEKSRSKQGVLRLAIKESLNQFSYKNP